MDTNDVTYDRIIHRDINDEMQNCYIDYAMSVIVSRALPDVRDGLKPVHRRILYSMSELGLGSDKQYRKSARIVGDTMGKYHPHGDSSIYGAMVRMAQEFSTRYPLVDGQGNFGSIDGDSPAAMRYTEARMSKMTALMLADIDKDTVEFRPNFDESSKEPCVLPSRFPNLLVNGSSGIAVGMATNIPPHNLTEVVNGVIRMIDNYMGENEEHEVRETEIEELMAIIEGPDFPTGATIYGRYGIDQAYRTGRGKVKVKAKAEIEAMQGGKNRIVVTEIPYMVNKSSLIEKMADLVKERKIDGITDIRDESDRNGISMVIELRRDVNPTVILNQLYKYTQLQDTFSINMLALVDDKPKVLNLKQILEEYLKHQKEVVTRRTQFELNKAEARAHILEGLRKALDNIDLVVSLIRESANVQEAKDKLMEAIELTEIQAQAIVEMRLRALTGLEREKIDQEYAELLEKIEYLKSILASEYKLLSVIKDEITEVKQKYGDGRRTDITIDEDEYDIEDLIDEENIVVTITQLGYIKRIPLDTYKNQNRGGKGIIGVNTIEDDFIKQLFVTTNFNYIMFFTNKGKAYRIKGYRIPEAGRTARGTAIVNLLELDKDEKITAVFPIKEFEDNTFLTMVTKKGQIKKTPLKDFRNIRKGGLIALSLNEEDELVDVHQTTSKDAILVATRNGQGIMFDATDVRPMGRTARGVRAINLGETDEVIGATVPKEGEQILTTTEKGLGKRTQIEAFRAQKRGGKGLRINKITEKTGCIIGVASVSEEDELLLITSQGIIIRIKVAQISSIGRNAQGVKLINVADDVQVVCMEKVNEEFIDDNVEEASITEVSDEDIVDEQE
ncbi:DNA gyrase subunit A [Cellulosilyticum sp. ST5]|uniref:DNA gyrase subunit A n=1 Tax=Cellulosilyticum lentocellum (strain ATCC 49066 / DSM 5427 / NCIMB 11756 / RHM5) TaxID=642492 RepID=F2JSI8_CELLD|nr:MULTISPECIES: DNA gyrase subunit A [Cellulosilyticum]ADZ81768.1 DNA gyrase, A subunit [Cellulosilyticum lentocellum DSM 5427]QEH67439.1 DNA gyrase subunit A [Cellulosilyticum sp. WCF-2]